jgi:hypothetical protein
MKNESLLATLIRQHPKQKIHFTILASNILLIETAQVRCDSDIDYCSVTQELEMLKSKGAISRFEIRCYTFFIVHKSIKRNWKIIRNLKAA